MSNMATRPAEQTHVSVTRKPQNAWFSVQVMYKLSDVRNIDITLHNPSGSIQGIDSKDEKGDTVREGKEKMENEGKGS